MVDKKEKWWEDPPVVVGFTVPRACALLERMQGHTVVRLTDAEYLGKLAKYIKQDCKDQFEKRSKRRAQNEVERERSLFIEGMTKTLSDDLADDPVFVVQKAVSQKIQKLRTKLRTKRQRNAERIPFIVAQWQRDRKLQALKVQRKLSAANERKRIQKELENRYMNEDAIRGMDLLRIKNNDWLECEKPLKDYLAAERKRMKARYVKKPTLYLPDPLDIRNVDRAKKEEKRRRRLAKTQRRLMYNETSTQRGDNISISSKMSIGSKMSEQLPNSVSFINEENQLVVQRWSDDVSDDSTEDIGYDHLDAISVVSRRRRAEMLYQELNHDVAKGLILSKEQYDNLKYQDKKIKQMRVAKNLRDLYPLAGEIIRGAKPFGGSHYERLLNVVNFVSM